MTPSGVRMSIYESIAPKAIESYLGAKAWQREEEVPGRAGVWAYHTADGSTFDILVPYRTDWRDYALRVADLISTLGKVEGRPVDAILRSILYINVDVIQLRVVQADSNDETIPWSEALHFIRNATNMVASAAYSVLDPLPVLPAGRPTMVAEYLQKLRMGQTERGSFIVNILSPIAHVDDGNEPYERRVTKTLGTALRLISTGDKEALESNQAFAAGVSANLCESLGAMAANTHLRGLDVSINLAPVIPARQDETTTVTLSVDNLREISHVGTSIREKFPLPDGKTQAQLGTAHTLQGYITAMTRPKKALDGRISVETRIGTSVRHVSVRLTGEDFSKAATALRNRVPISCDGLLVRKGKRSLELIEPSNLQTEATSD